MMKKLFFIENEQSKGFRDKLIDFVSAEETFCLLDDSSPTKNQVSTFNVLAGWGITASFQVDARQENIAELDSFLEEHKGKWIFGHMCYELKDVFEKKLNSSHESVIPFPILSFFVAAYVCGIRENEIFIQTQGHDAPTLSPEEIFRKILETPMGPESRAGIKHPGKIYLPKSSYASAIDKILHHLHEGDIYEINYCVPFSLSGEIHAPGRLWKQMQKEQEAPFGVLYKTNNLWLLCSSPERFIKKIGEKLLSQPMKGTIKRSKDPLQDEVLKKQLHESEKEKAENVMIVDLVRNDLGKISQTGTVQVDELFGIYSFPAVHQMISTVSSRLENKISFTEIIRALFPMGSMTGAPKFRAMEIIEEHEIFQRGLYSGSVGYIDPEGDFDFNVVIRSILYNSQNKTILFPAGSAITALSDPEKEYEECLLKAQGMHKMLIEKENSSD